MKRPSNLIIAFVLAIRKATGRVVIASTFLIYGISRIFFRAIKPPEIEIEEDYESQLYDNDNILVEFKPKIASRVNSSKPIKE